MMKQWGKLIRIILLDSIDELVEIDPGYRKYVEGNK